MLAIFLLKLVCELEVRTLRRIKTSDVFCITGGAERQNPLTLVVEQRQSKQVNSGLHVNADSLAPERGAALPFHFAVSTRALRSSVGTLYRFHAMCTWLIN